MKFPHRLTISTTPLRSPDGARRHPGGGEVRQSNRTFSVNVPETTNAISVDGKEVQLAPTGYTNLTFSITPKSTVGTDFLWALGAKQTFDIGKIDIQKK